jgi:hypothetical protein
MCFSKFERPEQRREEQRLDDVERQLDEWRPSPEPPARESDTPEVTEPERELVTS